MLFQAFIGFKAYEHFKYVWIELDENKSFSRNKLSFSLYKFSDSLHLLIYQIYLKGIFFIFVQPNNTKIFFKTTKVLKNKILVWLHNRLISSGLEPDLSHTGKSCIASDYRQFSTNIEI